MDRNEKLHGTRTGRPIQREDSTRAQAPAESKKRHRAKKSRLRQTSPRRQTRVEMACGSHFVRPPRAILNTLIQLDFSSLLLPDSVPFFRRLMTSFQVSNDRWNPSSFGLRHSSPESAPDVRLLSCAGPTATHPFSFSSCLIKRLLMKM
jgi:hypothetical protein